MPALTASRAYNIWSRNIFPFDMENVVLYLPLWQEDMQGSTILGYDRYHNSGTVTGATYGYTGRTFVAATPDYIEVTPTPSQLNFTSGDFSIIVRIYKNAFTLGYERFFIRGLAGTGGWLFSCYKDGDVYITTCQSGANQSTYTATACIAADNWYTLGASRSGAVAKIYRNGVDVTETSASHINPATTDKTAKIGVDDNKAASPFNGIIHTVIVERVNLSASEHLHLHEKLSGQS